MTPRALEPHNVQIVRVIEHPEVIILPLSFHRSRERIGPKSTTLQPSLCIHRYPVQPLTASYRATHAAIL